MRAITTLLVVTLLAGCGAAKESATPAALTLADFAGNWQMSTTLTGTPDPVAATMTGTADAASWTMTLTGRPNVALQVSIVGDSLVTQTAEYESILRAGVMVSVRSAGVMKDGALSGNTVATYKTPAGEEKVTGTFTATKVM